MNAVPLSLIHRLAPPRRAVARPPLLVLLHGVGSDENDLFGLIPYLDPRLTVVSARAPLPHPPGYGWYPIAFTPTGLTADESVAPQSREKIARFVDEAARTYGADPTRVFLAGFSQGAAMALYTLARHPSLAAGAALLSGRLLPQVPAEAHADDLAGKPILVQHGTYDPVLPIDQGRAIRDFLATTPAQVTYSEYPMAHSISNESLAELTAWLTARIDETEG